MLSSNIQAQNRDEEGEEIYNTITFYFDMTASGQLSEKKQIYIDAIDYSKIILRKYPDYQYAMLLLGNSSIYLGNILEAEGDELRKQEEAGASGKYVEAFSKYSISIKTYEDILRINPKHRDMPTNLTAAYRTRGKLNGEKLGKIKEAVYDLEKANEWGKNKDVEVLRLLGVAYGISGLISSQNDNNNEAIDFAEKSIETLEKAVEIAPNYVPSLYNLEVAYRELSKLKPSKSKTYLSKADLCNSKWKKIDPEYSPN
jgi:hypothetical protein